MEALGLGNRALRRILTDDALRVDLAALAEAVAEDRRAGLRPACVIATAGTVNTGATTSAPWPASPRPRGSGCTSTAASAR